MEMSGDPCLPRGLFSVIKGRVARVTLATMYAPNDRQDLFISRNLERLLEFDDGNLIVGSDFNAPLTSSVDPSSGYSSIPPSSRKQITQAIYNAQMVDVWHLVHSGERILLFSSQVIYVHRLLSHPTLLTPCSVGFLNRYNHVDRPCPYCSAKMHSLMFLPPHADIGG